MKRILLAATLLSAASPAISGPIMDGLLGGINYKSSSENIADGVEVYEGFEITREDDRIVSASLIAREVDGLIHVEATGTEFFNRENAIGSVVSVTASFDPSVRDAMRSIYLDGQDHAVFNALISREACAELDLPMSISMEGLAMDEAVNGRFEVASMTMSYDIVDPEEDCVVDFAFSVDDLKMEGANSSLVVVDNINVGAHGSMLTAEAPLKIDDTYTARAEINAMSISIGGAEQLRIDRILSEAQHDASMTTALVDTGYFTAVNALTQSDGAVPVQEIAPMSKIAEIWNALLDGDGHNAIVIENIEITGQIPQAMTGLPILSVGRSLNAEIKANKTDAAVDLSVAASSEGLADIRFVLSTIMTELDPGMGDVHPSAMMMSAPVSITGVGVELLDEGLGDFAASLTGFDLYADVPAMAAGIIGPQKAGKIADWLLGAKNGGAYFSAAPNTPLPVMQAFVGFMGDWNAFGQMINAKSSLQ